MAKSYLGIPKKYNESAFYLTAAAVIAVGTYLLLRTFAGTVLHANFIPDNPSPVYNQSHIINFEATNISGKPIILSGSDPWEVLDDHQQVIYEPANDLTQRPQLLPHQSRRWAWNQLLRSGQLLPPGNYLIKISYVSDGHPASTNLRFSVR